MKFLILLVLVACSTPEKKTETTEATASPTESNAQQVSPYTVQPCQCMKIFMPVCADGRNYGNSCEAECHGAKTWTEGSCANKKK
ncbi:MAG: Kazal-type serine protease inhibitor [Bdellovibrionota bacterium]